uniref:Uncharacterized protein n=1 Tax=Tanacetum cinerariifolium TaxID=118510 RepID=A0A6L2JXD6_TANCI|nr:hypothetical protein [Tanacetum cinerariifolium]
MIWRRHGRCLVECLKIKGKGRASEERDVNRNQTTRSLVVKKGLTFTYVATPTCIDTSKGRYYAACGEYHEKKWRVQIMNL